MAGSIDNFVAAIAKNGGMSMSNGYDIEFDFSGSEVGGVVSQFGLSPANNDSGQPGALVNMFCDEAQLPSMQSATGQLNGRYLGENNLQYAHSKMYSDFSLTWMCDANMAPYKFVTAWHEFIFSGEDSQIPISKGANALRNLKSATNTADAAINKTIRLKFPNQYRAILRIAKTERGNNAPNSRVSLVYHIEGCYPYSIDAVPLSYGSSQITKVTASFYYLRHRAYFADIRSFKG